MKEAGIQEAIPLRRESTDIGVLVALTTDVMQRQALDLGVALTVRVDDCVPHALAFDQDKVAWAVTSLVGSALRHVRPRDGKITVDVTYDERQSALRISVWDNGRGIAREQLSGLLRRGPWRPGAALALLLIADIASAHGGELAIESQTDPRDHYTRVSFTIH